MRVLLLSSPLDGSGPGRVMARVARELARAGVGCVLVVTHGPVLPTLRRVAEEAGAEVVPLRMSGMLDPAGPRRVLRLLRSFRPDVVHTRTIRADLLGRLAALRGVPVVNNVVNLYPEDSVGLHGPVLGPAVFLAVRASRRGARLFVANARVVAENVRDAFGVPEGRIRVVYDGVDVEPFTDVAPAGLEDVGIDGGAPVCLTVARLHPQKGLDDLVQAAADVLAVRPEWRFVIAGDGPLRRSLAGRIGAAGLEGRVVLTGRRDDVPALLARADVFVLPSRFEGLPSAAIEAMAAGLPVVATSVGGVPELVQDGVSGVLVPPASPPALAKGICEAIDGDRQVMGEAGRHRARELFSTAAMMTGFRAVYAEVASGA